MFKLLNIYTTKQLELEVNIDTPIIFNLSQILNKRNKDELNELNQFKLLNGYLQYKGNNFQMELNNRLKIALDAIGDNIVSPDLPFITIEVQSILELFDKEDVYNWLVNIYKFKPISLFKETFNQQLESDGIMSQDQTYIREDYLRLTTLIIALKSILGVIGEYAYVYNSKLGGNKELILYKFIKPYLEDD